MAELRRIHMFLLMILMLRFTATQRFSDISVRQGDDATLTCDNGISDGGKCPQTHWLLDNLSTRPAIVLVKSGQIDKSRLPASRSDRLSLTERCSLVIRKVTDEDVGRYTCRQGRDSVVFLSVVSLTEQTTDHRVTLSCSVRRFHPCTDTVKWLFNGEEVEENQPDFTTTQFLCFASVSFEDSHFIYSTRFTAFTCLVTDPHNINGWFSLRPSGEVTPVSNNTGQGPLTPQPVSPGCWRTPVVSVALTALILAAVVVNVWTRTKGNKNTTDENTLHGEDEGDETSRYENVGVSSASV